MHVLTTDLQLAIKALAYAWKAPHRRRYTTLLNESSDYLIQDAYKTILEGEESIKRVMNTPSPLGDFFHLIDQYPIPLKALQKPNQQSTGAELANDVFKANAVMVAPVYEHFTGKYPAVWESPKTCYSSVKIKEEKNGVYIQKKTAKIWRSRMEAGKLIARCEHCYHERVWRFCQQIEQESIKHKIGELPLRIDHLTGKNARERWGARVRQWRKRQNIEISYIPFPQSDGSIWVIHNNPSAAGGQELPQSREKLFWLIWNIADTPKGLTVKPSIGWGGDFKGIKGNNAEDKSNNTANEQTSEQTSQEKLESQPNKIEIELPNFGRFKLIFEAVYQQELTPNRRINIPIYQIIETINEAGLEYGVISGKERIKRLVTDKEHIQKITNKTICSSCVTNGQNKHEGIENQRQYKQLHSSIGGAK